MEATIPVASKPERIALPDWVKKATNYRVELLSPNRDTDPLAKVHKISEQNYAHTIDYLGKCTCYASMSYNRSCVHRKLYDLVLSWLNCPYHPNPTNVNTQFLFADLEEEDARGSEVILCRRCLGRSASGWPGRIIPAEMSPIIHHILKG